MKLKPLGLLPDGMLPCNPGPEDAGNNGCLQRKDLMFGLERLGAGRPGNQIVSYSAATFSITWFVWTLPTMQFDSSTLFVHWFQFWNYSPTRAYLGHDDCIFGRCIGLSGLYIGLNSLSLAFNLGTVESDRSIVWGPQWGALARALDAASGKSAGTLGAPGKEMHWNARNGTDMVWSCLIMF